MQGDGCKGQMVRIGWWSATMPTAITRIYTDEGFAIAADGSKQNDDLIVEDTAQKIFSIEQGSAVLAYSLAGCIGITSDSGEVVFDLVSRAKDALHCRAIQTSRPKTLNAFAKLVCSELARSLRSATKKRTDIHFEERPYQNRKAARNGGFTIARIFLDGYYNGDACRATLELFHVNQKFQNPVIECENAVTDGPSCYGSAEVLTLIVEGDRRFSPYRPIHQNWPKLTLAGAIEIGSNLIRAQMTEDAREIDPETCNAIGGHMHIATITRTDGFRWVPGYEPIQKA